MSDVKVARRLTEAMREADLAFETVGGSTRHFVNDCLLPALEAHHLAVVDGLVPHHLKSAERDVTTLARKLDAAEARVAELEAHVRTLRKALEYVWGELDDCEPHNIARFHEARRLTITTLAATEVGE